MLHHHDFLVGALEEAARRPGDAGCVIVLPAPAGPPERLLSPDLDLGSHATLWAPTDDGACTVATRGYAMASVGPSFASIAGWAASTLSGLRVIAHPEREGAFAPRIVGAQTFDPTRAPTFDGAWYGCPAAKLTLPKWTLVRHEGRCSLAFAMTRDGCFESTKLLGEIEAALSSLALRPPAAPERPRATVGDAGRAAWDARVRDALSTMREGRAEKLVAARRVEVDVERPWHLPTVLADLAASASPGCVRFAVEGHERVFVGVTPERLVSRRGRSVEVDALAGSIPRGADPDDDRARVLGLAASAKDLREHAHVVAGVRASLAPFAEEVDAPGQPSVRTLRNVHHLWTPVRATLREESPAHVLSLVAALHPTAALAGVPRDVALEWIASREGVPRGWYAGPVGWCDARGDGEFFVAIRSAVLSQRRAWVYAGAGLVEGSEVEAEWRETEAKMGLMLDALGVH